MTASRITAVAARAWTSIDASERRTDDSTRAPGTATGATRARRRPPTPPNASTGQLISQLTEQISTLVRSEARLAQAEVTQKAKRLGVGAGLFGGAGPVRASSGWPC